MTTDRYPPSTCHEELSGDEDALDALDQEDDEPELDLSAVDEDECPDCEGTMADVDGPGYCRTCGGTGRRPGARPRRRRRWWRRGRRVSRDQQLEDLRNQLRQRVARWRQRARDNGEYYERTCAQYEAGKAVVYDALADEVEQLLDALA